MTYGELTRSTEPLNWRKMLDNMAITPKKLEDHIDKMLEDIKKNKENANKSS